MAFINSITNKLYGDHCVYDNDCATDMNYICQSGKCACTSTTYYVDASVGCGIFLNLRQYLLIGKILVCDRFVAI